MAFLCLKVGHAWIETQSAFGFVAPDRHNDRHNCTHDSILAHCLRRWHNIKTTLGECIVFDGMSALRFKRYAPI